MKRHYALILAALAATTLTACVHSTTTNKGELKVATYTTLESAWDILQEGELTDLGGGCVGFSREDTPHLLVFPQETTVADGRLTIPGMEPVGLGDTITFSGWAPTQDQLPDNVTIPDACKDVADHYWLLEPTQS